MCFGPFYNFLILLVTLYLLDRDSQIWHSILGEVNANSVADDGTKFLGKEWAPLIPACICAFFAALFFRIIRLHDLLSDVFSIRKRFDLVHILKPLFKGCGRRASQNSEKKFQKKEKR